MPYSTLWAARHAAAHHSTGAPFTSCVLDSSRPRHSGYMALGPSVGPPAMAALVAQAMAYISTAMPLALGRVRSACSWACIPAAGTGRPRAASGVARATGMLVRRLGCATQLRDARTCRHKLCRELDRHRYRFLGRPQPGRTRKARQPQRRQACEKEPQLHRRGAWRLRQRPVTQHVRTEHKLCRELDRHRYTFYSFYRSHGVRVIRRQACRDGRHGSMTRGGAIKGGSKRDPDQHPARSTGLACRAAHATPGPECHPRMRPSAAGHTGG
jgi:hypothetical protein